MSTDTDLATLLTQTSQILGVLPSVLGGNRDFYAGTLTDPNSFDATGGTTGDRGYYKMLAADGTAIYFPCLARMMAMIATAAADATGLPPGGAVFAHRFRGALAAAGKLKVLLDNEPAPRDQPLTNNTGDIARRWHTGAPIAPGDIQANWIEDITSSSIEQMTALFAAAA